MVSRSSEHSILLSWKELECELCKKLFPNKMLVDGRVEELIDIPKPASHYIILETLCKNKDSNRGLLIISLCNKKMLKIGRANDSDIRIPDISVSRYHADITYQNGHFYLDDHNSKFGTLVQIKRNIVLDSNSPITIQAGRSLLGFTLRKN